MVEIKEHAASKSLSEATVVLSLQAQALSNKRKIASDSAVIQTEVDRKMLRVSHDLFDAPELEACYSFQRETKHKVKSYGLPSFMRGGLILVKVEAVETVDKILTQAVEDFRPLVKAFAEVVEKREQESKARLGPAYDSDEFPSYQDIVSAFAIKWNWFTLSTPGSLKKISKAFFDREAEKAEEAFKSAAAHSEALLLAEVVKLTEHMIERLSMDETTGKPKKFKDSIVGNVKEFVAQAPWRSLSTNQDLEAQFATMAKLVDGVDPKSLRTSDKLREDVKGGFEKVREALSKVIVEGPVRFMDME